MPVIDQKILDKLTSMDSDWPAEGNAAPAVLLVGCTVTAKCVAVLDPLGPTVNAALAGSPCAAAVMATTPAPMPDASPD